MSRRPPALPVGQLVRIGILVVLLVAVIFMKSQCGKAAESMFKAIDSPATTDGGLTSSDAARK